MEVKTMEELDERNVTVLMTGKLVIPGHDVKDMTDMVVKNIRQRLFKDKVFTVDRHNTFEVRKNGVNDTLCINIVDDDDVLGSAYEVAKDINDIGFCNLREAEKYAVKHNINMHLDLKISTDTALIYNVDHYATCNVDIKDGKLESNEYQFLDDVFDFEGNYEVTEGGHTIIKYKHK